MVVFVTKDLPCPCAVGEWSDWSSCAGDCDGGSPMGTGNDLSLAILRVCDLFGMVSSRDPLNGWKGDLQIGDQKVRNLFIWSEVF